MSSLRGGLAVWARLPRVSRSAAGQSGSLLLGLGLWSAGVMGVTWPRVSDPLAGCLGVLWGAGVQDSGRFRGSWRHGVSTTVC